MAYQGNQLNILPYHPLLKCGRPFNFFFSFQFNYIIMVIQLIDIEQTQESIEISQQKIFVTY